MASVLQEVDPDDLTTVLWDYTDSTGAANPGTVKTWFGLNGAFDLGAPAVTVSNPDGQSDTSQDVTFTYDSIVQTTFRLRAQATSYDNLRTGIGVLQRLLAADGVMRWVPDGSSNTYYIYRKPSNIPALFAGDNIELYERLRLFDSPQGVEIVLNRERLLRGPRLLSSVNLVTNATMAESFGQQTAPTNWAWDSTANITTSGYGANINWATQSFRFAIATTGTRNLQGVTGTATAAPGDVWTYSFYVKASGGTLCKAQAVLEFRDAGLSVLATATGTLTTLTNGADFVRVTVTSSAAPASTDNMRYNVRFANGDATSYTVDVRRSQVEKAATASQFRVGSRSVFNSVISQSVPKFMLLYNPGDANALARVSLTPSSSASAVGYLLARRSEGLDVNLTEGINQMTSAVTSRRTAVEVINATMYSGTTGDTSSQADTLSSGGANAARTNFTNVQSLVRRWRWTTTPTDPEALHGTWSVYAAVRGETANTFRICMHWQAANRDPVFETGDVITYDTSDSTSSQYTPLYLGDVTFDADAGDATLAIEGWAARDTGSGALWWDVVYLVPNDEQQTLVQVPGFRRGEQSKEVWLGSELTTQVSGAIAGSGSTATAVPAGSTKVVMAEQYEGVGTPPSTTTTGGVIWAAGRHKVSASVSLKEPAGTAATTIGRLRIRKAPGPGQVVQTWTNGVTSLGGNPIAVGMYVKPTNANRNGRTFVCTSVAGTHTTGGSEPTWPSTDGGTVTDNPGANQIVWTETTVASRALTTKSQFTVTKFVKSVEYTADGTTAYEGVVVHTAATATNQSITVLNMKHLTQRVVDTGYTVQVFGDLEVLQTANGSTAIDDLVKQGPYITLGPGLNVLWLDLWAQAPLAYDDMDSRGALALHDPTRTTTVSVDLVPRYWS